MDRRTRRQLAERAFSNNDLRAYRAALLIDASELRRSGIDLGTALGSAIADLKRGGDYYLAEAVSLIISLGGMITFQWLAVAGGVSALYASVMSRRRDEQDPLIRIIRISARMRTVRRDADALDAALRDVQGEQRRRQADPTIEWP